MPPVFFGKSRLNDTKNEDETKNEEKETEKQKQRFMGRVIDARLLPKNEDGLTCCRWCRSSKVS